MSAPRPIDLLCNWVVISKERDKVGHPCIEIKESWAINLSKDFHRICCDQHVGGGGWGVRKYYENYLASTTRGLNVRPMMPPEVYCD